ncbi:MAG: hypothetical protein HY326_12105 [Chloroflexi bacterium]|nr:hypothetical protein [Chloroflexota bacterium]
MRFSTSISRSDSFNAIRPLWRACRLMYRAAPGQVWHLTALNLIFGLGPSLLLYLGKLVIDTVTQILSSGEGVGPNPLQSYPNLVTLIIAFVAAHIVMDAIETLGTFEQTTLRDRTEAFTQELLCRKVAAFGDISLFEDPQRLDKLQRAEKSLSSVKLLTLAVGNLIIGIFVAVPVIVLTWSLSPVICVLLLASAVPSVFVQLRLTEKTWSVENAQAGKVREMRADKGLDG